jgi:hypothetical protein
MEQKRAAAARLGIDFQPGDVYMPPEELPLQGKMFRGTDPIDPAVLQRVAWGDMPKIDRPAEQDAITAAYEARHPDELEKATADWNDTKSNLTAHAFLAAAMNAESCGMISDEELLDAVAEVRDWLKPSRSAPKPATIAGTALNSYEISLALTVSAYGTVTVQAESLAAALEQVRAEAVASSSGAGGTLWQEVTSIDWCTEGDYRVLDAVNDADASDAVAGIDLVTDSFDVISADHLTMLLAAGR